MAFESNKLSTGELIRAALEELTENRREVLLYLGAFLVVDIAGALITRAVGDVAGLGTLLVLPGYFLAQYLLYRVMLRRAGHAGGDGRMRIFRFVALAVVIGFCLLLALYLFVIPAIVLACRWIAAPCYIVAADKGVSASLGESWSATRGNTLPLALAFTCLVLLFVVLSTTVGAMIQGVLGNGVAFGVTGHFLPLLLMGLSVAAYRRLDGEGVELAAVFA
jgi:hypothetical protein